MRKEEENIKLQKKVHRRIWANDITFLAARLLFYVVFCCFFPLLRFYKENNFCSWKWRARAASVDGKTSNFYLSTLCLQITYHAGVRLNYGTTHNNSQPSTALHYNPPSPTTGQNISTTINTHWQPKYIHHYRSPLTTVQNIQVRRYLQEIY